MPNAINCGAAARYLSVYHDAERCTHPSRHTHRVRGRARGRDRGRDRAGAGADIHHAISRRSVVSAKGICSLATINNPKTENPLTDISLRSTAARLGINCRCCCCCCACCCCTPVAAVVVVVVVVLLLLHPWATPGKTADTRASAV